jgi:DNA-binding MarR family transcriptional regulator
MNKVLGEHRLSRDLLMGETFKLVGKHFATALPAQGVDLTQEQLSLMYVINQTKESTQQELSSILHKDKSCILRLTDELERKQLVVRLADTQDRRKKSLVLTEKGAEIMIKALAVEADVLTKLLAGVTDQELEVFLSVLRKIQRNGGD